MGPMSDAVKYCSCTSTCRDIECLDHGDHIKPEWRAPVKEVGKVYDWTGITDPITVTELREHLIAAVSGEFARAKQLYPRPFVNAHEAHSVIREEFDEFEREVYRKCGERNAAVFRNELIQLAAMCIRTLVEVDPHAP